MKLLVISAPAPHPCRSAAALAGAAGRRKHHVHWVGAAHYGYLKGAGVTVHPHDWEDAVANGGRPDAFEPSRAERAAAFAEASFIPTCRIAREAGAELILCDVEAAHGPIVAETLGIPWASYSSGLFMSSNERRQLVERITQPARPDRWYRPPGPSQARLNAERRLNRLRARHRLAAATNLDAVSGGLHLIFAARSFEFRDAGLPAAARCVGSVFRSPHFAEPNGPSSPDPGGDSGRYIYLSWPSSIPDAAATLDAILAAIRGAGLSAMVETDLPIREDANVRPAGPRTRAGGLKAATLAICSGDFDVVQESLAWSVPLVVLPAGEHERAVGQRVEDLGLGFSVPIGAFMADRLTGFLSSLDDDDGIRHRVDEFALSARIVDGAASGLRYLERFAESGVAPLPAAEEDLIARLPVRPRRARGARLRELSRGVVVGSHLEQFQVQDATTARALAWLWQQLDGTRSIEHLLDAWRGEEDMIQLLDWLSRRKLLEEGSGSERLSGAMAERYAAQVSLFSHATAGSVDHPRQGGPLLQERLLNAKVGVVGAGVLGSMLIRDLALVGVGELHLAAAGAIDVSVIDQGGWYRRQDAGRDGYAVLKDAVLAISPESRVLPMRDDPELSVDGLDLVIAAQDSFASDRLRAIGRACHAANVPWSSVRRLRWDTEVGPTVIPGSTACFECFERRREAALLSDPERARDFASLEAGNLHLPFGTNLVAIEAVKLLTGFGDVASFGHVLVFSPMRMTFESHRILRIPDCPLCAARAGEAARTVWRPTAGSE